MQHVPERVVCTLRTAYRAAATQRESHPVWISHSMGYGVSKRSSPGDMAISHAAEPLPSVDGARPASPPAKGTGPMVPSARACAEPARTNGGSVWECQLCTFVERCGRIVLPDMSRTAGLCATGALPTSCTALRTLFALGP